MALRVCNAAAAARLLRKVGVSPGLYKTMGGRHRSRAERKTIITPYRVNFWT